MERLLRIALPLALVAGAILAWSPTQAEGRHRHHGRKSRHGTRWGWRPDMPQGWSWPPTTAMKAEGDECLKSLDELGVSWKPYDKPIRKIPTPIVTDLEFGGIKMVSVWRPPPYVMDCHLALALARDAAPVFRELGIKELRFSQIHDVRYLYGKDARTHRRRRMLSRHAVGLAVDVRDFVTEDDEILNVSATFGDGTGLLGDLERKLMATGAFRTVLTPRNDPWDHRDHFHIEARTPTGEILDLPDFKAPARRKPRRHRGEAPVS